jgi:uncharacterized spore protein YtfJ
MPSDDPLQSISEILERSLSIRQVFGEPVQQGDTTVIPVARVAYAFGAGGGSGGARHPEAGGAGGGGMVWMTPAGALEIGPRGTRFVRVRSLAPLLGAAALGLALGWVLGRRRSR